MPDAAFMIGCPCKACVNAYMASHDSIPKQRLERYICPRCSDRNCRHAIDHRLPCNGEVRG